MTDKNTPANPYEQHLARTPANYVPLTPLTFLDRAASVYPDRTAVVHGEIRYSWADTRQRCRRLASALASRGIGSGDTVAIISPNVPAIYEASFAVPMLGAVLNTINVRLDSATIAFILEHGEAKVLITDREYSANVASALEGIDRNLLVIDIDDPLAPPGTLLGECTYEAFLDQGDADFRGSGPRTSGRRSRSTTPREPRVIPRESSITIAART